VAGEEVRIALGVSHTPWVPERVVSLDRLTRGLGLNSYAAPVRRGAEHVWSRIFSERGPNWCWSESMWQWAAEDDSTHCLFLQDDVTVSPNFWPALQAMLHAVPDEIIGLEAAHPAGRTIARAGGRWYTTADMLIGPGYVMPRESLHAFLEWRKTSLARGALQAIDEDTMIGVFALATRRRIWHPVPTLIDHDTSVASTYGHDNHKNRRPSVLWTDGDVCGWELADLEEESWWRDGPGLTVHLGRFYSHSHWLAKQWVRGWTDEEHARAEADRCPERYARWV
jgi:hypothetical protein